MNSFNETWAGFVPTKRERRWQAFKDAAGFAWVVFEHVAFIGVVWAAVIMALSFGG